MEIVRVQQQALIEKRLFYAPVITARILSTYWRDMILVRNRAESIRLERIPQRTELRKEVRLLNAFRKVEFQLRAVRNSSAGPHRKVCQPDAWLPDGAE